MIKLIVAIRRNPAMSPAEFHAYWRTTHAARVRSIPACAKYIRRYVQAHTLDAEYALGEPSYDGTAAGSIPWLTATRSSPIPTIWRSWRRTSGSLPT